MVVKFLASRWLVKFTEMYFSNSMQLGEAVKRGIRNSGITLTFNEIAFIIADTARMKLPSSEIALLTIALPSVF